MEKDAKIYVAGHRGMVGSALVRRLTQAGYHNLVTRTFLELDLRNQADTAEFFAQEKPDYVLLAAARVGGIVANNTYRADFLHDNLLIQDNVISLSHRFGVKKLLFLGSSCIYPRMAPQPIKEEYLLSGPLEHTNEPYAVAKIAGMKLCEAYHDQYGCRFISVMPTNLYGPGDNYDLQNSHVLPALLRKFHEARLQGQPEVEIWGTGACYREFLHVDDLADACLHLMLHYEDALPVNIGTGKDISIGDLACLLQEITGYQGRIRFDASKPDGTPRKLLDVSRMTAMGWHYHTGLREGIAAVYEQEFCSAPNVLVAA
ncbi:GDP-L-fucose synthase family protein [Hymenobacter convexus]|uniref:GDP-L-fucose synthase family protein n=1 Tax=Hymenobacter sp. CA1UV-4 TaxID=3063782 RepID=UPI002712D755|nr:GDP-L-fucose synthase [Hymenobacter sp. CA1UV-4]MDO7852482.1 GDP-L-fucose synthase [Hymenobacter sp. CA1UV-4]